MSTGLLYDGGVGGVPPRFKGPTGCNKGPPGVTRDHALSARIRSLKAPQARFLSCFVAPNCPEDHLKRYSFPRETSCCKCIMGLWVVLPDLRLKFAYKS